MEISKEQYEQMQAIIAMYNSKNNTGEDNWKNNLKTTKQGYDNNIGNYKLWLQNGSERYTGKLKYNKFFDFIEYNGKMIPDEEEKFLEEESENFFDHKISRPNLNTAFTTYVYENAYNPITDYLEKLKDKWDGKKRLETFIIKCLDAEDNKLNRFFTKTWMIAAVKRAFEPGCQFDCVLALQGGVQGSGKTSLIRRITLEKYYKTFSADEFKNKDCIDKMNKSWVTLLDEFDKFDDKEVADLKCKITEKVMAARKSYAHNTTEYNVHWVYAATTNADDFLCDLTGDEYERRYWIVECKKDTVDSRVGDILTDEYVNQLWAEAVHYYFAKPDQELFLSSSNPLFEEYKKFQMKFKKTANNTSATYIDEILNRKYVVDDNGFFKNSIDMYNQFTGNNDNMFAQYINKVPVAYVRFILKKVYNVDYSPKIIKSILMQMGNKWEIKQLRYLGTSQPNILHRVNEIKNEIIDYSKTVPF